MQIGQIVAVQFLHTSLIGPSPIIIDGAWIEQTPNLATEQLQQQVLEVPSEGAVDLQDNGPEGLERPESSRVRGTAGGGLSPGGDLPARH